jgi:CBS domain-containing protein
MARPDLLYVAQRLELVYYPAHDVILDSAAHDADLHIIQRGHVQLRDPMLSTSDYLFGSGECFPLTVPQDDDRIAPAYIAAEDTFCLRLGADEAAALRERSAVFADYCSQSAVNLMQHSIGALHREFSSRATDQQSLMRSVGDLVRQPPTVCRASSSIRDALVRMSAASVGTIAVTDVDERPVGIFTLTDLMNRVVLARVPLAAPIESVMTPRPGTIDTHQSAHQALASMALSRHHQLVVTTSGRVTGVISERDLFTLQRISMQRIVEGLSTADSVPQLMPLSANIRELAEILLAQGASAESLTSTVSALNDALTQRLVELTAPEFELRGIEWSWLGLGSEGRNEQTIASDQDNAIIFAADYPDKARGVLLAFAKVMNERLAALGFPLCRGNIMASNPDLCLTAVEWRQRFEGWVREPTPAALLDANIFFDFRHLAGNPLLALRLRSWLQEITPDATLFIRLLIENACSVDAPLGRVRAFATADYSVGQGIDLKGYGTRLFVDAGRVLALAFGLAETSTSQRLKVGGRRLGSSERDLSALTESFHFLQLLRLRSQAERTAPSDADDVAPRFPPNVVDPYRLNDLEQRMLKEALRQARVLQGFLRETLVR